LQPCVLVPSAILDPESAWIFHSLDVVTLSQGERSANLGLAKSSTRLYVWTHKVPRFCLAEWHCQNVFLWEHSHCSHGIRRINIIHWQIAGSILSRIKTSMKCLKGHRHQKLRLRLGQPTGRLNFALQTRRYQVKSPELIEGNSVSCWIGSRKSFLCQSRETTSQIRNLPTYNTCEVCMWLHVLHSFRPCKTTPLFPNIVANNFLTATLHGTVC